MRRLTKEYFDDRQEQGKIVMAIFEQAIKPGQRYCNILLALNQAQDRILADWMKEENAERWHGKEEQ